MNERSLISAFLIYTMLWQGLIWIGGFYVILDRDWSPWFVVLMTMLSAGQFKPKAFRQLLA